MDDELERAWHAHEVAGFGPKQHPLIKEADPELEALLREEEEIEARALVHKECYERLDAMRKAGKDEAHEAYGKGYLSANDDFDYRMAEFLRWLFNDSTLDNNQAFSVAQHLFSDLAAT